MRRLLRLALAIVLVLALGGTGLAVWKRAEIARLLAVNTLFDEDRIVANFSSMERMFHTRTLDAGQPTPLPAGPGLPPEVGEVWDAWQDAHRVTAHVILHRGALVSEAYRLGTGPDDRRISWSIAKSFLALLLGILHEDGTLPDLDIAVDRLVPELRGSAYAGVSLRDVARMASGVAFDENYLDFHSDINRMGRVLALGRSMDGFAAGLTDRHGPAGAAWRYVSIDTHVLGMAIRAASGRSIPELMEERLLRPVGLDPGPFFLTDSHGVAFVLGGLNMTTRDFARLGWLVAQGGRWEGREIVPEGWIARATAPQAPGGALYGYQWWVPPGAEGGETFARGIYGQYLWIDPAREVVIAVNAANRRFNMPGADDAAIAMFRALAAAIAEGTGARLPGTGGHLHGTGAHLHGTGD